MAYRDTVADVLEFLLPRLEPDDFARAQDLLLNPGDIASDEPPDFPGAPRMGRTTSLVNSAQTDRTNPMQRPAMDAAVIRQIQAIRAAEDEVRPYVGDVVGMDSVAGVYHAALKRLGHDARGISPGAAAQTFRLLKSRGAKRNLAMDAKATAGFAARFPNATPHRVAY